MFSTRLRKRDASVNIASTFSSSTASSIMNPALPNELPVPHYTEHDETNLFTRIEQVANMRLPILRIPASPRSLYEDYAANECSYEAAVETYQLQTDIVNSFFTSVENKGDDAVVEFVTRGFVSPDVTNARGETPLLAAVRIGNLSMVQRLISLGALVDGYGCSMQGSRSICSQRTALQEAAGRGNLAIVRVLMEEHGANDALIAPDGALALRLAAGGGHKEIVQYLPARRGGAFRRWKVAHRRELKIIRGALSSMGHFCAVITWHIPRHLVWVWPKKCAVWSWQQRHEFGGWLKRQILSIPSRAKRAFKRIWKFMKDFDTTLKQISQLLWGVLKAIPGATRIFLNWIIGGLKKAGIAVSDAAKRVMSVLHTIVVAIFTWFRSITLKDIWNGLYFVMRAVLVEFPRTVWSFATSFPKMAFDVLAAVFGFFGEALWHFLKCLFSLFLYIPQQLWVCVKSLGRLLKRGSNEGLIFLDPKRI